MDDLDAVLLHFQQHTYHKAVLFVDNAGADVILGMLPFARQLLKGGAQVGRQQRHPGHQHSMCGYQAQRAQVALPCNVSVDVDGVDMHSGAQPGVSN